MHVRVQSNGKYWQFRWTDQSGQQHVRSGGAKAKYTRQEAQVRAAELAAELGRGLSPRPGRSTTLSQWIERYLSIRCDLADTTLTLHRQTAAYMLQVLGRDTKLDQLTRSHATDFEVHLHNSGLAPQTVAKHVRHAKAIISYAQREDLVAFNFLDRLSGRAADTDQDWPILDETDVLRVIHAQTEPTYARMIALAWYAGLRLNEILALTWQDVDVDAGKLLVSNAGRRRSTKRRRRDVRLEPDLVLILHAHLIIRREGLVCPGVSTSNIQRELAKRGCAWPKPLHTLRKNRTTRWLGQFPEPVVNAWMGHSRDVGRAHYFQVDPTYYTPGAAA